MQRATHRRLAEYFAFRPDPEPLRAELAQLASRTAGHPVDPAVTDRVMAIRLHPRRMEEHPWQLVRAQEWQQLQELLGDPVFLDIAYGATVSAPDARKTDLLEYWTQVEAGSAFRLVDAYRPMIDAPDVQSTGALVAAAILLHDTEHSAEALVLTEHLAHRSAATGDLVGYADALIEQALNRDDLGDPGGAIAQCREAEAILRRLDTAGARQLLMTCLINLGNMLRRQADPDIATAILREAEELAGELGDRGVLASSLYNQALLLEARGDRRGAIELLDRDEAICRERGDLRGIASSIATRARLTEPDGPDRALAWLQEAEDIARRLGLRGRQLEYLYGQARILRRQGRTAEALDAFRAGERLAREAPDRHDLRQMLVHFLGNISLLLVQRGEYDAARQILDEQEAICREIDDRYALQATLGDRVFLHVELGELEEALELVAQQERICREIDHPRALLLTLVLQAQLFRRSADLDRAAHSYAEAADLARALDDRERLDACLASLVDIQSERTAPSDVRPLLEERAQVLRSLDRPDDLQHVLVQLAVHHRTMGEPEYAESALEELEQLIQQRGDADAMDRLAELRAMLGDVIESAGSICLRANAHMNDGRLDRALEVFEQAMTRYPSYVWGWSDMGICLLGMDRYAEAERALTRATELGADDVGTWAPLGATRLLQGNLDGALDCLRVCVEIDIHDPGTRRLAAMMHDHLQEAVAATGEDDPAVHDLLGDLRQIVEADQSRHPGPGPPSGRARRSRREGR